VAAFYCLWKLGGGVAPVGQTIAFGGLSCLAGDRRHQPIVCPTLAASYAAERSACSKTKLIVAPPVTASRPRA
jgi:hypothetical protein